MKCPSCGFENPAKQKFCGDCGHSLESRQNQEGVKSQGEPPASGERRHVTVLFSDLTGYTAMTERLDPEEVREIMAQIFGEASQVIGRYGGVVEKYIGDAIMAVFGLNQAHEDDGVRAVRAAREIHGYVETINPRFREQVGRDLGMHTGINTGLVITGQTGEAGGAMGVVGDAVNVASRLSDLAKAGQIFVGPETANLIERYFELEPLSAAQVKGKSEAIKVYQVQDARERPAATRRFGGPQTGLVGRDVEVALLKQSTQRLRDGQGSITTLRGEAGTGKSRLIEEFKQSLPEQEYVWHAGNSYDYAQDIPYFLIIDLLNQSWGIEEQHSPAQVREIIETRCNDLLDDPDSAIPYLGSLYNLEYPAAAQISPEYRRENTHAALLSVFQAMARAKPTVFHLEDLHWADPSTIELLRHVLTHFQAPAIIVCTYRPPFSLFPSEEFGEVSGYREIDLESLSPTQVDDLTATLLGAGTVPAELRDFVRKRAGGNPFFVEEMLAAMMESGVLIQENGGWTLSGDLDELKIPGTVQGIIAARLDRLEPANRKLLQESSVIGRNFFYEVLNRITTLSEDLHPRLKRLEDQDLIRAQAIETDLEYMFKHPLTQEVVYNSLLIKDRQTIHQRVGQAIEEVLAERLPEYYERLAYHFLNANSYRKAVDYLMKSGGKSVARFSLDESHRYYQQAYDHLVVNMEPTPEESDLLIELVLEWGKVFIYFGTFRELVTLMKEHLPLAETLPDSSKKGMYLNLFGFGLFATGKSQEGYEFLQRGLAIGEETKDEIVIGYACIWLTFPCSPLGYSEEALAYSERALAIAEKNPHDLFLNCIANFAMGFSYFILGEGKKSIAFGEKGVAYGEQYGDSRSKVLGYVTMGLGSLAIGDLETGVHRMRQATEVSRDPFYANFPSFFLAVAYLDNSEIEKAQAALEKSTLCQEAGFDAYIQLNLHISGLISVLQGRMGRGVKQIEEARRIHLKKGEDGHVFFPDFFLGTIFAEMAIGGERPSMATIIKNLGFLLRNLPFADRKAESYLKASIESCRKFNLKSNLAQSLLLLGRLHKAKKRKNKARECLAEAIAIFEATEATGFLEQARGVLSEIEARA